MCIRDSPLRWCARRSPTLGFRSLGILAEELWTPPPSPPPPHNRRSRTSTATRMLLHQQAPQLTASKPPPPPQMRRNPPQHPQPLTQLPRQVVCTPRPTHPHPSNPRRPRQHPKRPDLHPEASRHQHRRRRSRRTKQPQPLPLQPFPARAGLPCPGRRTSSTHRIASALVELQPGAPERSANWEAGGAAHSFAVSAEAPAPEAAQTPLPARRRRTCATSPPRHLARTSRAA